MSTNQLYSIDVRALPLWAAALPLVTINICYLVAIGLDHLPACFTYFSGCTSVSSTGRLAPESLIFRAGMLPSAVIVMLFWRRCSTFLEIGGQTRFRLATVRVLGVIAALSMTIYTVTLGFPGNEYRVLRRVGIDGFALSNYIAQVLFVLSYRHMSISAAEKSRRWLVAVCVAIPAIAIAGEVAKWMGAPRHPVNNVMAWNALLLQCTYFVAVSRLWNHHEFACTFRLGRLENPNSRS